MQPLEPLAIAEHVPIGEFLREWYTITARCKCGHQRELGNLFIRRVIGITTPIGKLQSRLRCHQCGKHAAVIEVRQLPR